MSHAHWMYLQGIFVGIIYGAYGHKWYLSWQERRWQRKTQGKRRY